MQQSQPPPYGSMASDRMATPRQVLNKEEVELLVDLYHKAKPHYRARFNSAALQDTYKKATALEALVSSVGVYMPISAVPIFATNADILLSGYLVKKPASTSSHRSVTA